MNRFLAMGVLLRQEMLSFQLHESGTLQTCESCRTQVSDRPVIQSINDLPSRNIRSQHERTSTVTDKTGIFEKILHCEVSVSLC
jgi:hypothetical protein